MKKIETLRAEIATIVSEMLRVDPKRDIDPAWVTSTIGIRHAAGLSKDREHVEHADHWRFVGSLKTREEVGQFLRRNFDPSTIDEYDGRSLQLTFPGLEHVQTHYLVRRKNQKVAVATERLSYEELTAIEQKLARFERAIGAHRAELRRFRDEKFRPRPGGGEDRVSV